MTRIAVVGLLAGLAVQGQAPTPMQARQPRGYFAYRAASSIVIDGKLDDGPWKTARWSESFVDIEGSTKPQPLHLTRVKMLWDQIYFYIGAELTEPHLWATLKEHDSVIFRDNDFEVFIDPNGDNHEYYEIEINALGTTWDLLLPKPYKDDGKAVNGWEIAGMKSAVSLDGTLNNPSDTDRGWSVELALPWKALGELARRPSPPADGDQWRVNFSRVEWQLRTSSDKTYEKVPGTKENNWVWSPQGVIDMHRPEVWGYVQFSTATDGDARYVFDPSWPARRFLLNMYYAQREYRRTHGVWAASLEQLRPPPQSPMVTMTDDVGVVFDPILAVAGDQYEISVKLDPSSKERWHIRQDSLIWKD